jgi:hypothetical protein
MDGNQGPDVVPAADGDSLICLAGRVRAADLSNLGPVIADVTRTFATFPLAADCAGMLDQIRELEDVKSALADLRARIVADPRRQQRGQAEPGDFGAEGFVAGGAGAAADAAATHTGHLSARPGSVSIVGPPEET